ncbi:uncharacterized protein N7483_010287 [Penicillium malachiteum]|uniref:uncharacterized protein n=1 Tax=Penicillium malachiteum TaxID=1324776 RepID=UPI002547F238|nr:uncharacterized protein N7483_010287 [Penicillium malachiteum]KAJ5713106.1 hypothetical protein N7483_010287 [Penicillium malachiteum]
MPVSHDTSPPTTVIVPDMFSSIMSTIPKVNKHYEAVKIECNLWVKQILGLSEAQYQKNLKAEFALLGSLWVPEADKDALRLVIDWLQWVFYFDDLFDDGVFKDDPEGAKREVEGTLALMSEVEETTLETEDLSGMAFQIDLPSYVIENNSVKECEDVCSDLVLLVNDALSFKKEQEMGVQHNIINLLQHQGLSLQQAMNQIGVLLNDCYRRWYTSLAEMPIYGESVDRELARYIEGCRIIALGNLHWSYATGRYLGTQGVQVRKTRVISIGKDHTRESNDLTVS